MIVDRTTRLRLRRGVKQRRRQIEDIRASTDQHFDKHFFRRLGRLYEVRRFIVAWVLLLVMLIGAVVVQTRALGDYFLKVVPVEGGLYAEGMIGAYTNASPIFASSDVDASVSRLLFSGLLTYSADNKLAPGLATEWSVDQTGKVYTLQLRRDVRWHDDKPFTADDVVFTIRTIQNPDARSPYFASWQGIAVAAADNYTVTFKLPNILASFPYSLTIGMLPMHKLEGIAPTDLRGSLFNTVEPIGTGPFKWNGVEVIGNTTEDREQRVALVANDNYYLGRPKIDEFIIRAFLDEAALTTSFEEGKLNAVAGALSVPLEGEDTHEHNVPLTGAVTVFLNTQSPKLQDARVRRALTMATSQPGILSQLSNTSVPVYAPLLPEHVGYDAKLLQHGFNPAAAGKMLDEAGWTIDPASGLRTKEGQKLSVSLMTISSAEYASVANQLQKQWRAVGVELQVNSLAQGDLQAVIDGRGYDALIYGIVMGLDADQFAYWHSSQADARSQRRLNFSNYKSATADSALEAGRTRIDPALRAAKYAPFLQAWRDDAPAITLYRPRFLYTTYGKLYNFEPDSMNSPIDRYNNVEQWMIRTNRAIQ